MVPPGGFLRGEQFERERVVPPLSRLLCFLSCRSKKGRPRWQALAKSRLENRRKGYNRVSIPTSKYHPQSKPELHRPLAPSVTATPCQLPPGGSHGVRTFPHGFVLSESACCGIPQTPSPQLPTVGSYGLVRILEKEKKPGFSGFSSFFIAFSGFFKAPYGSLTVKRQPVSRFSTSTCPPRVVRICFTRASPRPLPSAWWELSLW